MLDAAPAPTTVRPPRTRRTRTPSTKPLQAAKPAAKRTPKASPEPYDLEAWLAGYKAGERGDPHTAPPRKVDRASWLEGHLQAYKHNMLAEAVRAAMNARHHGGEDLADIADTLDPVHNGAYGRGFLAGMRLAVGLTWRGAA